MERSSGTAALDHPSRRHIFGRFKFEPSFWFAYFLLVLIHEFGHALLVHRFKLQVLSIDVTGMGGLCTYRGQTTPWRTSLISWGGVAAQALVLAGAYAWIGVIGQPEENFGRQLLWAFTHTNLWLIGLNLLPIAPLDGVEAWRLLPMALARLKSWRLSRQSKAASAKRRREVEKSVEALEKNDETDAPSEVADAVARVLADAAAEANRKNEKS